MPHIVVLVSYSKLEKVLSVLANAIGVPLTDQTAHVIAELIERRTFHVDEVPDVPGGFEHPNDRHLIIVGKPGRVDIDVLDHSIDFVHPDDEVVEAVKQRLTAA